MVEPLAGSVLIDGLDICKIGLNNLRRNVSIIPQDPVVFAGTVRFNLDPFGEFADESIWSAIDQSHLKGVISRMEGQLDAQIQEDGSNLSVGQRQLLCLARAILRKNRIIVLDEATANIDLETDALIQKSIRQDFQGYTVLTIAHRLNTVIDYDRILVLEAGRVVEFDTPHKLLSDPNSLFLSLVHETGENNESLLRTTIKLND